jgi:putative hydrolase
VEEYAQGINLDTERVREAMRGLDPSNPAAIQEAMAGGLFEPEDTPAQRAALQRVETLLALIEGWVESVTTAAAADRLPSAVRLTEAMRRRRGAGGPAERTLATILGLELRPRRMREAAALWEALAKDRGTEGRDALWDHPDLLPDGTDLDDPEAFIVRSRPEPGE